MSKFKVLALAALLLPLTARADLQISVTKGTISSQPVAVVPFASSVPVPVDIAGVVDHDLSSSGLFRTLNRGDMLEKPSAPAQVDFRNWRVLGMDDLVIGQVRPDAGGFATRFYLLDVYSGQQLLAYDIPAAPPAYLRYVGHQIADLIYQKLTGKPGYFNTQIAYISVSGPLHAQRWQLIVADSDGENPHVIATSREPLMSPSWSPDRKQLAYVGFDHGRSAIYLHTLATGALRRFLYEPGINGAPAWSPDGKSLAVTLSFGHNPDIYIVDVASGARRRLTHDPAIDTEASWSPDGQSLVFTSDRGGSAQVYKISAGGGEPQRLTFAGKQNMRPVYSPDGKQLALVNNDGGALRLGLFDLQTGQMRLITSGPLDESPSFAPNGTMIMYAGLGPNGGTELKTVSTDGRVTQSLRQVGSEVQEPAWSPYIR
jgi:TolB protein